MKQGSVIRLAIAGALTCIGVLAFSASGALATGTTVPAAGLSIPIGPPPPGSVSASCPSIIATGNASVTFLSGNAVLYGPASGTSSGGNAEGIAVLYEGTTPMYQGHTHAWFGGNGNAQGEMYFGETFSFNGTALDGSGSTLTVTMSGGDTVAAHANNTSGWGHAKVTCS